MRWVVGVLVARPLESQGEEAAVGRSDVAIVVVGARRTRLGGCLGVLPRPSLCADGKLLLDGLAGRAPGVDLPNSSNALKFEVAVSAGVNVVRGRGNELIVKGAGMWMAFWGTSTTRTMVVGADKMSLW